MPWPVLLAADVLIVAGLVVLTLALAGLWRFDDLFARLHAVAKVGSLGLVTLLLGSFATGDWTLVARTGLVVAFLVLTSPVASYAIARAAHRRQGRRAPSDRDDGAVTTLPEKDRHPPTA